MCTANQRRSYSFISAYRHCTLKQIFLQPSVHLSSFLAIKNLTKIYHLIITNFLLLISSSRRAQNHRFCRCIKCSRFGKSQTRAALYQTLILLLVFLKDVEFKPECRAPSDVADNAVFSVVEFHHAAHN